MNGEILTGAAGFSRAAASRSREKRLRFAASGDDAVVAQAVLRARPVRRKRLPVLRRSVSSVVLEAVRWIAAAELVQEPIALDLRDHGCGGDRRAERVAVDDR